MEQFMARKQLILSTFLTLLFLVSCDNPNGYRSPPKTLSGRRLIVEFPDIAHGRYHTHSDGIYVYQFISSSKYQSKIKGKVIEEGSYQYEYESEDKEGHLKLSYQDDEDLYTYQALLSFKTNSSGNWRIVESASPTAYIGEEAAFTFVSKDDLSQQDQNP